MTEPFSHPLRSDRLAQRRETEIDIVPDAEARARIAEALGLSALRSARLQGRVVPGAADSLVFEGSLSAEVVQPCGITLAPVRTTIDERLRRVWSPHAGAPSDGGEFEMGDDETEPLDAQIDFGAVLVEALSLAIPAFPRAPGAMLAATDLPDEPETRRPLAGLADLLRREGPGQD